jgi:CheY-like chemotaxis protein
MAVVEVLKDRRVLVVEDEYLIAAEIQRGLRRAGAIVLGPVPSVAEALMLVEQEPTIDSAILDITLGGEKVYPVVDRLLARGAACVFATGTAAADLPAAYAHLLLLQKPVNDGTIVDALTRPPHAPDPLATHRDIPLLEAMHEQLQFQLALASDAQETLVAAKLSEVLAAIENRLHR